MFPPLRRVHGTARPAPALRIQAAAPSGAAVTARRLRFGRPARLRSRRCPPARPPASARACARPRGAPARLRAAPSQPPGPARLRGAPQPGPPACEAAWPLSRASIRGRDPEKNALHSFSHRHTVFYTKSHFYSNILLPLGEYLLSGILVLSFFCPFFFFFFFFQFFDYCLYLGTLEDMVSSLFLNPSFSSRRSFRGRGRS